MAHNGNHAKRVETCLSGFVMLCCSLFSAAPAGGAVIRYRPTRLLPAQILRVCVLATMSFEFCNRDTGFLAFQLRSSFERVQCGQFLTRQGAPLGRSKYISCFKKNYLCVTSKQR